MLRSLLARISIMIYSMCVCTVALAEYQSDSTRLYKECGLTGRQCANVEHEKEMMRLFNGKRNGRQLCLPLSGHIPMDLCMNDNPDAGEGTTIFHLIGYLRFSKVTFYVVRVGGYESAGIVMINTRTGQQHIFTNIPVISPDGNHAVITMVDLDAGYFTNAITIFHVTESGFKTVTEFPIPSDKARWVNNDTILFEEMSMDKKGNYHGQKRTLMRLNGQWQSK